MVDPETSDTLVALLRRTTDEQGWLQAHLDDPDSAAILMARVAIFARLGVAAVHNAAQATISSSSGGVPGTSAIAISRTSGTTTGTIPKGFGFIDLRGIRVVLQVDVPVTTQTVLILPVQTLRQSEIVNTEDDPDFAIDPQSPVVPASVGVLIAPAGTAGVSASTFQAVGPSTKIDGGAADYLSVQGAERGIYRQSGESIAAYRQRVLNIPDAVSPIAIADVVQGAAQQPGIPPLLTLEPFEDGATPALKALHGLGSFSGIAWDVDFWDDPIPGFTMLDRRMGRAYFLIQAQDYVVDAQNFGVFWDDFFFDDPVLGYPLGVDAFPPTQSAALLAIVASVDPKRAGGVQFDLELKSGDLIAGRGTRSANTFGEVITLTPPAGTIWYLSQVLAGHSSPTPSAAIAHHVTFDLEGGASFTSADFSQTWTEIIPPPGARVTAVHGFLRSDGSIVATLVIDLRAVAVKL